jgi:hypothetical protein
MNAKQTAAAPKAGNWITMTEALKVIRRKSTIDRRRIEWQINAVPGRIRSKVMLYREDAEREADKKARP